MKKSELRNMIREEIGKLGQPNQQQLDMRKYAQKLYDIQKKRVDGMPEGEDKQNQVTRLMKIANILQRAYAPTTSAKPR